MPDSPSDGEQKCMSIAEVFTLYRVSRSDGVIEPQEDEMLMRGFQEATIDEEGREAATVFAIQLLRHRHSAPNQPVWRRIQGVWELAQWWRAREKNHQPGLRIVVRNDFPDPPVAA
jgi:hypothetical protein